MFDVSLNLAEWSHSVVFNEERRPPEPDHRKTSLLATIRAFPQAQLCLILSAVLPNISLSYLWMHYVMKYGWNFPVSTNQIKSVLINYACPCMGRVWPRVYVVTRRWSHQPASGLASVTHTALTSCIHSRYSRDMGKLHS